MSELLTMQDLANGHLDVKALGEAANGDENTIVTTRTGNTYPSAERAINSILRQGTIEATIFNNWLLMVTDAALLDDAYALVTSDPDSDRNGYYQKRLGVWVRLPVHARVINAPKSQGKISLFPDVFFEVSGGNVYYRYDNVNLYMDTQANHNYDYNLVHGYGKGAWWHDGTNTALTGFNMPILYGDTAKKLGIKAGDKISIGAIVQRKSGTGFMRFSSKFMANGSNVTYQPDEASTEAVGGEQLLTFNNLEVPVGGEDLNVFFYAAGGDVSFYVLSLWVVAGESAGALPPLRNTVKFDTEINKKSGITTPIDPYYNQLLTQSADQKYVVSDPIYKSASFTGYRAINDVYGGFATPFEWNGTAFDMVKVYLTAEKQGVPLRVRIWSGDREKMITESEVILDKLSGYFWVQLHSSVSTSIAEIGVLYLTVDTYDLNTRLMITDSSAVKVVADSVLYPQLYSAFNSPQDNLLRWGKLSNGTGWSLAFELFSSKSLQLKTSSSLDGYTPSVVMPPYIYAYAGLESHIYPEHLLPEPSDLYLIDVDCEFGKQTERGWVWAVPEGQAIGSHSMYWNLHDKRTGGLLTSGRTFVQVANKNRVVDPRKVLLIGDSYISSGQISQRMLDLSAENSMKLTFIGTQGTGVNKHEGRGGWTVGQYTSDFIGNPFWIGGAINFGQYITDNALDTPDVVIIHLGVNDSYGSATDNIVISTAATACANLDLLIASILAKNPLAKIGIAAPNTYADQDAFGLDGGNGVTAWRAKRNIVLWNNEIYKYYKDKEVQKIYIIGTGVNVDTKANFPTITQATNSHNSAVITVQSNAVHPNDGGYKQIGDVVFSFIQYAT